MLDELSGSEELSTVLDDDCTADEELLAGGVTEDELLAGGVELLAGGVELLAGGVELLAVGSELLAGGSELLAGVSVLLAGGASVEEAGVLEDSGADGSDVSGVLDAASDVPGSVGAAVSAIAATLRMHIAVIAEKMAAMVRLFFISNSFIYKLFSQTTYIIL